MAGLNKVVHLVNRRFLAKDHELRGQCDDFNDKKAENRAPPEQASNTDIKWNSIAHV